MSLRKLNNKDIILTGCSGRRPSMTGGNNAMDSDTMPLNFREGHEYDKAECLRHKFVVKLDTPVKPEYDKAESFSLSPSNSDTLSLSPSGDGTFPLSPLDNDTLSLSPSGDVSSLLSFSGYDPRIQKS